MINQNISFIGAGNMASSLVGGLLAKGVKASRITMSDTNETALANASRVLKVNTTNVNAEAVVDADVVVLAVKPQVMKSVCESMQEMVQHQKPLVISIAAGVTAASLDEWLGGNVSVVRCMPNTPALVQSGATAMFANNQVDEPQKVLAKNILSAVGIALWVDNEAQLDAVTALSGSGPAYFFLVMEAMIASGVQLGLSQEMAEQLTLQTALGASQMAITSDDDPAQLRQKVTSPGGTTERAIQIFEKANLRDIFANALQAAKDRSEELAKNS